MVCCGCIHLSLTLCPFVHSFFFNSLVFDRFLLITFVVSVFFNTWFFLAVVTVLCERSKWGERRLRLCSRRDGEQSKLSR